MENLKEIQLPNSSNTILIAENRLGSKSNQNLIKDRFMQANTEEIDLTSLNDKTITPVFSKDNEPLISHGEFIETFEEMVHTHFTNETITQPSIRVSHPIKGRIPEAKGKPAKELLEHEKTLSYERMAFIIEIPSILEVVDGEMLSLCISGVRSFNLENLGGRKSNETFKAAIGFSNSVCTNQCISTDGTKLDIKANSTLDLQGHLKSLIEGFNIVSGFEQFRDLTSTNFSFGEFTNIVGRAKIFIHGDKKELATILNFPLGDAQLSNLVKDYYQDNDFKHSNGIITGWKLFNLMTNAAKSSYIDSWMDKNLACMEFVQGLCNHKKNDLYHWYLNP